MRAGRSERTIRQQLEDDKAGSVGGRTAESKPQPRQHSRIEDKPFAPLVYKSAYAMHAARLCISQSNDWTFPSAMTKLGLIKPEREAKRREMLWTRGCLCEKSAPNLRH